MGALSSLLLDDSACSCQPPTTVESRKLALPSGQATGHAGLGAVDITVPLAWFPTEMPTPGHSQERCAGSGIAHVIAIPAKFGNDTVAAVRHGDADVG